MDTKYKEDLFRKYVQFHESKLEASDSKQRAISDEYLRTAASALLSLPKIDPSHRFRLIRFYDVCDNSLKSLRTSNLRSLHNAAAMLETIGINLFLYPWKKEYKNIKTYTGPFVYYVRAALIDDDIRHILNNMGYAQEHGTIYRLKDHVDTTQVKRVAFELFLARVECELLLEIYLQVKDKGYLESDVVNERKNSNEDVRGCTDEMKRRSECKELNISMARMVLQKSASERAPSKDYFKQKVTKPSKSVDTYDSYWDSKNKPPLPAPLSLRKEPILVDAEDDLKDEIIRPSPSLLTMSSSLHGCSDEFLNLSSNPNGLLRTNTTYSYYPADDEVDLYTDMDSRMINVKRQELGKPDVWLFENKMNPSHHKRPLLAKETVFMKCQNCGGSSGGPLCQKCDGMYIYRPDGPTLKQSNLAIKSSVANDSYSSGSGLREKSPYVSSSQDRPSQQNPKTKISSSSLRCSFCNKPGASNTCTICSKVACETCLYAYSHEYCCRKSEYHKFAPNNQLNYKSSQLAHLVYR